MQECPYGQRNSCDASDQRRSRKPEVAHCQGVRLVGRLLRLHPYGLQGQPMSVQVGGDRLEHLKLP